MCELSTMEMLIWFDMVVRLVPVLDVSSFSTTLRFLDSVEHIGVTVYGASMGPLVGEALVFKECSLIIGAASLCSLRQRLGLT